MIETKLEELAPAKLRNQVLSFEEFKEYLKNNTGLKEQIATLLYFQWQYASDVIDETNDNDFKTVYDEERLNFLSDLVYNKLKALDQQVILSTILC